jgi:tRNA G37 N-methylase Trm5
MTATETDPESAKCAAENVEKNGFSNLVQSNSVNLIFTGSPMNTALFLQL